jgi:hypothetical protein
VPVLYLSIYDGEKCQVLDLEALYQLLVPDSMKKELDKVGIMGNITTTVNNSSVKGDTSLTRHPVSPDNKDTYLFHSSMSNCRSYEILGGWA